MPNKPLKITSPDPSRDQSADASVDKTAAKNDAWALGRIKVVATHWTTISLAIACIGGVGGWAQGKMTAAANKHADAGDDALRTDMNAGFKQQAENTQSLKDQVHDMKTQVNMMYEFMMRGSSTRP